MVNVTELNACSDCGTVYVPKLSNGYCPKCNSNLNEKVTVSSSGRSLDK